MTTTYMYMMYISGKVSRKLLKKFFIEFLRNNSDLLISWLSFFSSAPIDPPSQKKEIVFFCSEYTYWYQSEYTYWYKKCTCMMYAKCSTFSSTKHITHRNLPFSYFCQCHYVARNSELKQPMDVHISNYMYM